MLLPIYLLVAGAEFTVLVGIWAFGTQEGYTAAVPVPERPAGRSLKLMLNSNRKE